MMVDCALEPRSVLAANVARAKNAKSHELADHLGKFDPFLNNQDILLRTAYGYNTLGMPKLGTQGGVDNIDARSLQQFMMENITPKKCLIVAAGVQNHSEFVELVKERIGEILPVPEHVYERAPATYIGGEQRVWTESPQTSLSLAFEGANWKSEDVYASVIAAAVLGHANSAQRNNPGSGRYNRASANLVQKNNFIDRAGSIDHHFSDSGLFGISVEGPGANSSDILKAGVEELHNLTNHISDEELQRAKNHVKMEIALGLGQHDNRLEEIARNFQTHGHLSFHQYADKIDAVSSSEVNSYVSKTLQGKPTMLVSGGAINLVPAVSDVQRMLN